MKAILQRVLSASVTVESQLVSSIGRGVLVFAAVAPEDTKREVETLAEKICRYKLWPDDEGSHWKKNVADVDGEILCVSQFTLLAKTKKGTKPDFHGAAGGDRARELYAYFVDRVATIHGVDKVRDGVFQAMMQVGLVNDGPVTLELEVNPPPKAQGGGGSAGKNQGKKNEAPGTAKKAAAGVSEGDAVPERQEHSDTKEENRGT